MKRERVAILLLSGALGLSMAGFGGCNRGTSGSGGNKAGAAGDATSLPVGIVSFDTIARGLGWTDALQSDSNIYKDRLSADLNTVTQALKTQIEKQQQTIAPNGVDKLTPQQQQQLVAAQVNAQNAFQSFNQQAAAQLTQYQRERINHYREALAPVVRQVAQQRKVGVVLLQSDQVMFADTSVDLSDSVIGLARSQPPTVAPVNMEPLKVPQSVTVSQNPTTNPSGATTRSATTKP